MIASRMYLPNVRFYVAQLPGEGGADWGYTTDARKAIALSRYWARRFASDCRRMGSRAIFT